jgi:hypothetical protein
MPKITGLFKQKGVLYERNLSPNKGDGYSWQEAFETNDPKTVEKICDQNLIDLCWKPNDRLILKQRCPATIHHPVTGDEVWFNQAEGFHSSALDKETYDYYIQSNEKFRLNSFFGDGQCIPPEMLANVRSVLSEESIPHKWQKNDILILDNVLTAHGRMPFLGARKIALSMT